MWGVAPFASAFRRLASFARVILFDRRGTGLSDRIDGANLPTLEARWTTSARSWTRPGSSEQPFSDTRMGRCSVRSSRRRTPRETCSSASWHSTAGLGAPDFPWAWTAEAVGRVPGARRSHLGFRSVHRVPDRGSLAIPRRRPGFSPRVSHLFFASLQARERPSSSRACSGIQHSRHPGDDPSARARHAQRRLARRINRVRPLPSRTHPRCPPRRVPGRRPLRLCRKSGTASARNA